MRVINIMSISGVPIFPEVQRDFLIPYLDLYSVYLIDRNLFLLEFWKRSTTLDTSGSVSPRSNGPSLEDFALRAKCYLRNNSITKNNYDSDIDGIDIDSLSFGDSIDGSVDPPAHNEFVQEYHCHDVSLESLKDANPIVQSLYVYNDEFNEELDEMVHSGIVAMDKEFLEFIEDIVRDFDPNYYEYFLDGYYEYIVERLYKGDREFLKFAKEYKNDDMLIDFDHIFFNFIAEDDFKSSRTLFDLTSYSEIEESGVDTHNHDMYGHFYGSYLEFMIVSGLYKDHPTVTRIIMEQMPADIDDIVECIGRVVGGVPVEISEILDSIMSNL